jgi:hypothetical protein
MKRTSDSIAMLLMNKPTLCYECKHQTQKGIRQCRKRTVFGFHATPAESCHLFEFLKTENKRETNS